MTNFQQILDEEEKHISHMKECEIDSRKHNRNLLKRICLATLSLAIPTAASLYLKSIELEDASQYILYGGLAAITFAQFPSIIHSVKKVKQASDKHYKAFSDYVDYRIDRRS